MRIDGHLWTRRAGPRLPGGESWELAAARRVAQRAQLDLEMADQHSYQQAFERYVAAQRLLQRIKANESRHAAPA
jgi:hypothetical protein